MIRRTLSILTCAALLFLAPPRVGATQYSLRPTLDDLIGAGFVAVGGFAGEVDTARFVSDQELWGRAAFLDAEPGADALPLMSGADGELQVRVAATGLSFRDHPTDAAGPAIWFFLQPPGHSKVVVQPLELLAGFAALHRGELPSQRFRLLQDVDADMRREACEELFADRDPEVIAALHRVALEPGSRAAHAAVDVLMETRLLELDLFWGSWTDHPARRRLELPLRERDAERVQRELRAAAAAEERPPQLELLLLSSREDVELNLQFLDHAAEGVRDRALSNLYSRLGTLARHPRSAERIAALAQRLLPLLEARRELEHSERILRTLDAMLEEQAGLPWVLRVPTAVEPPPAYNEEEERDQVVRLLLSNAQPGFVRASAGEEVVEHFFDEGIEQLRAAADSPSFNAHRVYEGMGYVHHPRVFEYLVEHATTMEPGHRTFAAVLRAIGLQNHERSFEVLEELIESRVPTAGEVATRAACDALGHLRDPRALSFLKDREDALSSRGALHYLQARLAHGDPGALEQILAATHERGSHRRDALIRALLLSDAPEVTELLRQEISNAPSAKRGSAFYGEDVMWCMPMQNHAGGSRRTTALGELARRDPHWLANFALELMESPRLSDRTCGAYLFRGLTGRSFEFRPEAFAAERAAPLSALQAWWADHEHERREDWLLSYFDERGFEMERLHEQASLPVLVRALAADPLTHGLAVEQILVITGKYFGEFAQPSLKFSRGRVGSWSQQRTTTRVTGWLGARGWLPEAK